MILPFRQQHKAGWHLVEHLDEIEWLINLADEGSFFLDVVRLYPKLERFGVKMPSIHPTDTGMAAFDDGWSFHHRTLLTFLRGKLVDGAFNLEQWNAHVEAHDEYRMRVLNILRGKQPS